MNFVFFTLVFRRIIYAKKFLRFFHIIVFCKSMKQKMYDIKRYNFLDFWLSMCYTFNIANTFTSEGTMKKKLLVFALFVLITLTLVSCSGITVTWLDADGAVLYTDKLSGDDTAIPEKPLPEDNDNWDYIEWKEIETSEKSITIEAQRVEIEKHVWIDTDGTVLNTSIIHKGTDVPDFPLPQNTDSWHYTGWDKSVNGNVTTYTALGTEVEKIIWTDVDGTVLYTVYIKPGEDIPERLLPNDTKDWHYTGWEQTSTSEGRVKFVAERIAKEKVHWLDVDGTLLYTDGIIPGTELEMRALPKNSAKWIYDDWKEVTEQGGERTFKAVCDINPNYFKGNVFQIITYDIYGRATSAGTGFIFNKNGWFITNSHVMEDAVRAEALFEIENFTSGSSYTVLDINHGYLNDADKDIFIGRIEDYSKIANKYQSISMTREYAVGDTTYSVGYPNASVKMEINRGEVTSEHSKDFNTLYSKLTGGVTYIPSTSYIAPGSSGGILVNENLEVIGMTTLGLQTEKEEFIMGASISVFNYQHATQSVNKANEKSLIDFLYPEKAVAIKLFLAAGEHENCTGLYKDDTGYYYELMWEHSDNNLEEVHVFVVYDNGLIAGNISRMWYNSNNIMMSTIAGEYKGMSSIGDFKYLYTYDWSTGASMTLVSQNVNYSSLISDTLKNYQTSANRMTVTQDDINNAKKVFNETYLWFCDILKELG